MAGETTAQDLIRVALNEIGIYGASETLRSDDAQLGLTVLNDMMDSWSNESLSCFCILEQTAPLISGQAAYTIGPGGDFDMVRPLRILEDPGTAYTLDSNGNKYPLQVVPRDKWNMYSNTSSIVTSNFPTVLFYDPQYPLGIINITPFPNIAYQMYWDSYQQLESFPALTTTISLPPGYNAAIRHNLAAELWPFFGTGELAQTVVYLASQSKGNIKRTNIRPEEAVYDSEIVSRSQVQYNWQTDSVGSVTPS